MSTLATRTVRVKPRRLDRRPLAVNEERVVNVRSALYHVRRAPYVAFGSRLNDDGNNAVVDVSRAVALRVLSRLAGRVSDARVTLADCFGTLCIGAV